MRLRPTVKQVEGDQLVRFALVIGGSETAPVVLHKFDLESRPVAFSCLLFPSLVELLGEGIEVVLPQLRQVGFAAAVGVKPFFVAELNPQHIGGVPVVRTERASHSEDTRENLGMAIRRENLD